MGARLAKEDRGYARAVEVRRAVKTARDCGIDVGSVDLMPDGTIRVSREVPNRPSTEFDRWDAEGRL